MPFRVSAHLMEPAYQAAVPDRTAAEWPPHPSRIFCGLVSVADPNDPVQDAALRWLEEQPPPLVQVPAGTAEAAEPRSAWVPTNRPAPDKDKKKLHGMLPGRVNGGKPKAWPQRNLACPQVEFRWQAEPPGGVQAVLEALAAAVPYLGRATGHAIVHAEVVPASGGTSEDAPPATSRDIVDAAVDVTADTAAEAAPAAQPAGAAEQQAWEVWEPLPDDTVPSAGARSLRVPFPGYLERLRTAHAAQQPAWQHTRSHPYAVRGTGQPRPGEAAEPDQVPGPFADLVCFAFPAGHSLDPALTMAVTGSLRRKVRELLDAAGHDADTMFAVHGHKTAADTGRVCAFLALPFVGRPHADGRLRGVGVALPRDLEPAHRRALLAVLLRSGGGLRKLAVRTRQTPLALTYVGPGAPRTTALDSVRPRRWTRPSREWTTALPMVLDRFPKRHGRRIEEAVATGCRLAGLPEPQEVQVMHSGGLLPGTGDLPASALRRKPGERPLPSRHVRVRFAAPVTGPVVLGSKKNFGLGLCLPTDPNGHRGDAG